jgi:hypothetical protein
MPHLKTIMKTKKKKAEMARDVKMQRAQGEFC